MAVSTHAGTHQPHVEHESSRVPGLVALAVFLAAPFAVAYIGAQWTVTGAGSWYETLAKPSWNPPGWVFGPVWSTLYLLMGIAGWRIWQARNTTNSAPFALSVWVGQIVLNLGWSYAFFERQSPISGLIVIVALWLAIAATIVLFAKTSKWAALMLVPYIAWVSFATALNFRDLAPELIALRWSAPLSRGRERGWG